ncbi:MAG: hypothetical protein FWD65_08650 [Coriobacteriia bacterium]|nr:hypothetical protein [Coriobacteriia bacterium]
MSTISEVLFKQQRASNDGRKAPDFNGVSTVRAVTPSILTIAADDSFADKIEELLANDKEFAAMLASPLPPAQPVQEQPVPLSEFVRAIQEQQSAPQPSASLQQPPAPPAPQPEYVRAFQEQPVIQEPAPIPETVQSLREQFTQEDQLLQQRPVMQEKPTANLTPLQEQLASQLEAVRSLREQLEPELESLHPKQEQLAEEEVPDSQYEAAYSAWAQFASMPELLQGRRTASKQESVQPLPEQPAPFPEQPLPAPQPVMQSEPVELMQEQPIAQPLWAQEVQEQPVEPVVQQQPAPQPEPVSVLQELPVAEPELPQSAPVFQEQPVLESEPAQVLPEQPASPELVVQPLQQQPAPQPEITQVLPEQPVVQPQQPVVLQQPVVQPQQPVEAAEAPANKTASAASIITDKQLRALSRKHLLIMIRDLEKELARAKEELEDLLLAYRAGVAQGNAQNR